MAEETLKEAEERNALRPLDMLGVPKSLQEDGKRLLWSSPENVDWHKHEGYEVVSKKVEAKQPDGKTNLIDSNVVSREMVLMRIAEDKAKRMEQQEAEIADAQVAMTRGRLDSARDEVYSAMKRAGYSAREADAFVKQFENKLVKEQIG